MGEKSSGNQIRVLCIEARVSTISPQKAKRIAAIFTFGAVGGLCMAQNMVGQGLLSHIVGLRSEPAK